MKDLTLLVRVPGRPEDVRAFTDPERDEAATHAAQTGGICRFAGLGTRPGPASGETAWERFADQPC
jgi:hypothetical protein